MSHDNHHGHAHHDSESDKPVIAFNAAFYFVLIVAGLFICALGFVKSMGHEESGHGGGHATEQHAAPAHAEAAHEEPAGMEPNHAPAAPEEAHAEAAHH